MDGLMAGFLFIIRSAFPLNDLTPSSSASLFPALISKNTTQAPVTPCLQSF